MRRGLVAGVVALAVVGMAPAARAQGDPFRRGLSARDQDPPQWREVVDQMTAAIQQDPKESDRKIGGFLGVGGTEYLPYLFLGEAYFNLGDCARAVVAWEQSAKQKVVERRADFRRVLAEGNAACEAKGVLLPGKFESVQAETQKVYESANALSRRVSARGEASADLWQGELKQEFETSATALREAYELLMRGGETRLAADFAASREAAERARTLLTNVDTALEAAIARNRSVQAQAAEIEQILADAESHLRDIESRKAAWSPSHASGVQDGRDALTKGRDRLATARKNADPALLPGARTLAIDASSRLKQVLDDLVRVERIRTQRSLTELQANAEQVFSLIEQGLITLDRRMSAKPDLAGPDVEARRETIKREVDTALRRLEDARKAENVGGVRQSIDLAQAALENLNALIATFGPVTLTERGVHPVLQEGARLFFLGEYEQAIAALADADSFGPEVPLRLHAHLLRAAALHALYLRSGESEESLRARAIEEIGRCRAINPEFVPDTRAYSPSFVAFFQQVADAPDPAAVARP